MGKKEIKRTLASKFRHGIDRPVTDANGALAVSSGLASIVQMTDRLVHGLPSL